MVDVTDAKLKQIMGKSWSTWNLAAFATENDSIKLREAYKPKEPDKPRDQCNLLPLTFLPLYGTKPEVEYFSVTKCPACRCVMKSQWMLKHFKRDHCNSLVCRRTEMIVNGNRCIGKATIPLYDIRESAKDPLSEFSMLGSTAKAPAKIINSPVVVANIPIPKLSPPQKHTSHKTESSATSSSSSISTNKSKSNSSSSHSKKHSSSTSQSTSSSKHHKSSKSLSPSSSSTWSSSSKKESSSGKSHKQHSTASYVLSIPSDDSSHNESVESILLSNSAKQTMHIITGKTKSSEPEYEQLKFYADSSDKRNKMAGEAALDSKSHKLHFSPQLENFKIPLKNKSSSGGHTADISKKSKSSSHSHSTKSGNSDSNSKTSFRHSSPFTASSTVTKPVPSLTIISEAPKMNTPLISPRPIAEVKEKSHSKKKKKKKSRDEPRKIIPLKERDFNPDQHCGVVSEDALPCTRSLTCKTHSIALRRAVPGRSHQFDSLLAAHKKARDEEKAKLKEVVEDPKSKAKKVNNSTPLPADSDSSSSSLPQPPSVGKGTTPGVSSSGKPGPSSITFNATSISSDSPSSNNVKHSSLGNAHAGSKTVSSHAQSLRQQVTKPAATAKTTNRPVIIVDEKKQTQPTQGLSLFELRREPENSFVYIACVEAPKIFANIKEGKNSRNNALSEWNPLDRLSRRGIVGGVKKKGFKDPLIALLANAPILGDTQGKDVTSIIGDTDLCVSANEGRTTTTSTRANFCLKRKLSSGSMVIDSVGSAKKTRSLHGSHQFYEPLLYKTVQKPECTLALLKRSEVVSSSKSRSSDGVAEECTDSTTQSIIDEYSSLEFDNPRNTPRNIYASLSNEAREFLQNHVKAHSDKESLDKVSLSEEEMCQYAFELINKFIVS